MAIAPPILLRAKKTPICSFVTSILTRSRPQGKKNPMKNPVMATEKIMVISDNIDYYQKNKNKDQEEANYMIHHFGIELAKL